MYKTTVNGITLPCPPWEVPAQSPNKDVPKQQVPPTQFLSAEDDRRMVAVLEYLKNQHSVGMTLLARAVEISGDLRSRFRSVRPTERSLVEKIAAVIDVTVPELYTIEALGPERQAALKDHLKQAELIDPRAGEAKKK